MCANGEAGHLGEQQFTEGAERTCSTAECATCKWQCVVCHVAMCGFVSSTVLALGVMSFMTRVQTPQTSFTKLVLPHEPWLANGCPAFEPWPISGAVTVMLRVK